MWVIRSMACSRGGMGGGGEWEGGQGGREGGKGIWEGYCYLKTISLSHLGKASNFKINYEEGQYYISTRKRFVSVTQLLEFYRNSPIKSKQKEADVYLLFPIPVNEELEAGFEREVEAKKGRHDVMWHDVMWHDVMWHDVMWHDAMWHDVMWECDMM